MATRAQPLIPQLFCCHVINASLSSSIVVIVVVIVVIVIVVIVIVVIKYAAY